MLTIRDYNNNEYPLLSVKTINEELNGQHDLELKVPKQKNNNLDLLKIDKLWEINYQNVDYKIVYIKKITKGDNFYLDIRAKPLFYFDMDKQIIHENKDGHYTAKNALDIVFNGSGYQYILVDFPESLQIDGFGKGETRLEMFKRLIERLGLEFYIVGKTVYLKKLIGNDTNFMYKYKLNASNIAQSIDASNYFLKISGFGNFEEGSDDYVKDAKLKREYTSPLAKVIIKDGEYIPEGKPIVDGRVKDTAIMDMNLKKAVEDSLEISIDGNLHDVRSIYKEAVPVIGDRIFLIDERIKLEQEIRIHALKSTYDVNDNLINCEVTFGSQNIRDRYKSNLNSAARDFKDLMKGNIKLPTWSLEGIARDMINKIHAAQSEILFGDFGMQAISKTNPNHVSGWNNAGWYISTDGGKTARTIATAEGILADAITVGTLRGIIVEGVEIYGSSFYSINGENDETFISGGRISSTGFFKRRFNNGKLANYKTRVTARNGLYLISTLEKFDENNNSLSKDSQLLSRGLYLHDKGMSTQIDSFANSLNKTGRYIDLFSDEDYDSGYTSSGMKLFSDSRIWLQTSMDTSILIDSDSSIDMSSTNSSIFLSPNKKIEGINTFQFYVVDDKDSALTDGVLQYGSTENGMATAIRFSKNPNNPVISFLAAKDNSGAKIKASEVDVYYTRTWNIIGANPGNSLYIGVSNAELAITNNNLYNDGNPGYRPVRAASFYGDALRTNGLEHLYLQTYGAGEIRLTQVSDGSSYKDIRYRKAFESSHERNKTRIEKWDYDVLEIFKNELELHKYMFNDEIGTEYARYHHGIVLRTDSNLDTFPVEWRHNDGFDSGEVLWWNTKAIQELAFENDELKSEIAALKSQINKVMEMI